MKTAIVFFHLILCFGFFTSVESQILVVKNSENPSNGSGFSNIRKSSASDSLSEYEIYRSVAHRRLNGYEKLMDNFSARVSKEDEKVRLKNQPVLQRLERIDAALRVRVESYKPERDWMSFKLMTTRAIDAFGIEITDLTIEN